LPSTEAANRASSRATVAADRASRIGPLSLAPDSGLLTFGDDIKPILDSDCIQCHGPRLRENGVDLSTYAGVSRVVQAGNANSLLVLVTRSNGQMYPNLTGDRAAKSALIRSWVVDNAAAETR